jgi:hypothetical protein
MPSNAFFSELNYLGPGGQGGGEFVEITIAKTENLGDYTVGFYDGSGYLTSASSTYTDTGEISLQNVSDLIGSAPGSINNAGSGAADLQIVEHPDNADYWVIQIPTGMNGYSYVYDASAVSLYNTATNTLVSAYDIGQSNVSTLINGVAAGSSTVSTGSVASGNSIQIDYLGNLYEDQVDIGDSVVCFTRGTLIKTDQGEVAIEELAAGDMVLTTDNGYQPIRWIGSSKRAATGDLAPILIRKGALGNDRDLRVSPQHRMLLQGWQAEMLFGAHEVLATAKSLLNDHSIVRDEGGEVEYFHILFDTHEIIYAEGCRSESFHPAKQGWKALDQATRDEILTLFPQLADGNLSNYGLVARMSLKHKEGKLLGSYMAGSV